MADEEEKGEKGEADPPKKSKLGLIIGIVVGVILLIGGTVGGAVLAPKLLGGEAPSEEGGEEGEKKKAQESKDGEKDESKKEGAAAADENMISETLPAIIVDLRDEDGRVRHLKVGMSAELPESVTPEEFRKYVPRARETAVTFLRSLTFEEISDPKQYIRIKTTLSEQVKEALGPDRVHRILLVEFVAQ